MTYAGTGTWPNYHVIKQIQGTEEPDWFQLAIWNRDSEVIDYNQWMQPVTCQNTPNTCVLYAYDDPVLYDGNYTAYVRTYTDGLGIGAWSNGFDFVVDADPPAPMALRQDAVYDNQPFNVFNECPPTGDGFSRTCDDNMLAFRVSYGLDGFSGNWLELAFYEGFTVNQLYSQWFNVLDNPACGLDNMVAFCNFAPEYDFEPGTQYTWRVRSYGPGGAGPYTIPNSAHDPDNFGVFYINP